MISKIVIVLIASLVILVMIFGILLELVLK
jgi:hypothetical protein